MMPTVQNIYKLEILNLFTSFVHVLRTNLCKMPSKRKITVSQRSAFWPCGTCRQNCRSDCIRCDSCKQWYHAKCEDLSADDFKFYTESTATYTCENCFSIDVGSSQYNFLYGLTRMRQVNILTKNARVSNTSSSAYILLRLDVCWIHEEDILKCNTFLKFA